MATSIRHARAPHEGDRFLADDIASAKARLLAGDLHDICPVLTESLRG